MSDPMLPIAASALAGELEIGVKFASVLISVVGALTAGWSFVRTRKRFYEEYKERRKR